MPDPISSHQAWLIAAQWGSYMRDGDPGACMYGFNGGPPQSAEHRDECLLWIDHKCFPIAEANSSVGDMKELLALEEWLKSWPDDTWPQERMAA